LPIDRKNDLVESLDKFKIVYTKETDGVRLKDINGVEITLSYL